ncbi:MAG: tetratricopeptide repeat protein, partial [Deltaproteobacteria bacterium]|nr:tetratricopeptide repeat protein [Deltaproteobacteria bacterium]
GVQVARIAAALEPHYARMGAWRRYVEMLEARRQHVEKAADRLEISRKAARVLEEELRAPREAFKVMATALADQPNDGDLAREVERLATLAKMPGELCDVLQQVAGQLPEGPARLALLSRRAALLADALGRDGDAITAHKQLVADYPKLLPSWDALVRLHSRRGEWALAADALEASAGVAPEEARNDLLLRLGQVCMVELKDHARAAAAYEPLRASLAPNVRDQALDALDTCYQQLGNAVALASVLADRAQVSTGNTRAEFRARLAEAQAGLGEHVKALEQLEAALTADIGNARARAVLEGMLDAKDATVALGAARLLEPAYRAANDARGLARVMRARLDATDKPEERRDLTVALATTYARDLRQPDAAVDLLSAQVQRDPADEGARRELEAVARFAGKPERIAETYEAVVAAHPGTVALDFGKRLGAWYDRAGDRDGALRAYGAVLAKSPKDAEALAATVRLRRLSHDARPLAESLEQMADNQSGEVRASSLREAAALWSRVNDTGRALEALRRGLEAAPDDTAALRMMAELHEVREEPGPLADVLMSLSARMQDPERSTLLVRLGRLRLEKLADAAGAIGVLAQVLEGKASDVSLAEGVALLELVARAPGHDGAKATELLTAHYRRSSAPAPLAALLEHRAGMSQSAAERARILDEVGAIYEKELAQREQAFMSVSRAYRDDPTEERRARAEALAGATRAYDAYAGILEDVAEALSARDPVGAAARWREVARVAVEKLSDRALAIRAHREILRLVPGDGEALKALETFHRAGAETDSLVEILKAKAAAATAPADRRAALLQAARLLQDERGDLQGAEAIYKTLLAESADDAGLLELMDALYMRSGQNSALAAILPRRIRLEAVPQARAQLGARLGRLFMDSPGGTLPAFQVLQKAAEDDEKAPEVANALAALLETAKQTNVPPAKDVARVLEKCVRARSDFGALSGVLEARLIGEPDHAQRASVLMELARMQEEIARQPTLAFMAICRAVRESPGDDAVRERAERLAQVTDSQEELAAVYEDVLAQTRDGKLQALLSRRVAAIMETRMKDPEAAINHLRNALLAQPDDIPTLEQMARLLRARGVSPDLLDVLRRLARQQAAVDNLPKAKEAYLELAQAAEQLADVAGAIAAFNDVLQLDPADRAALKALERLYGRAEKAQELAGVLQMQVKLAQGPGEASDTRIRLAEVRRTSLGDPVGAATLLQVAAQEAPGNPRLLGALEATYADLAVRVGNDATQARLGVATLLEPRYEALGDAQKLCSVLEARLDGVTEAAARRALWRRVAGLREGPLRNPELAFAALGRALKETPEDEGLRADVERLAQATGDIETLVGLYLDVLEEERTGAVAILYRRRVATLYESGLSDPARAVEHFRLALDLMGPGPDEAADVRDVRLEILTSLERLHRALREPAALADVLRRRAALETDPRAVRALLMEVSKLQGDTQDTAGSIATLRRLLEINPSDLDALRSLQRACEAQERWQELVDALLREAELCRDQMPDRELDARYRAASILDGELDRPDDALEELGKVLRQKPDHAASRAYLEDRLRTRTTQKDQVAAVLLHAYEAMQEFKRVIDVTEMLVSDAELAGDRDKARSLLMQVAQVYREKLQLSGPAFGALCRALRLDRTSATLRTMLLDLARDQGTVEELAEVYEDEASSADMEGRTPVAATLREAAAELHETELGAPERAMELYEQVLSKVPGRVVPLEALQRLYEKAARWNDFEATVRKRLAVADGPEERAPLLCALGMALGRHLSANEEAAEALEEAGRLQPDNATTRRELIWLYGQIKQHARRADLMLQELHHLERGNDAQAILALRREMAQLYNEHLNRPADALPHVKALREAFPTDRAVFEDLEVLYRRLELWMDLKALYEDEIAREKAGPRVQDLSSRLGGVLTDHLGELNDAIVKYTHVLELNPRDMNALDALRKIYKRAQRWEDLVGVLRRMRRLQTDTAGIKAIQFDLAEVLQAQGKKADAVEAGRRVLDIEPHTDEELVRLYEVFLACEAFEECAGVLERRVGLAQANEHRMALLFDLAELWEGPLARREKGASAYERILQMFPNNVRAHQQLSAAYEVSEDWRKLVGLKEARLPFADVDEKVRLLTEMGALYEQRLGEKPLAFLAACRAFRESPGDHALGEMVERLAVETDSVEEAVAVLEDVVGRVDETHRAIDIYLQMAHLCAEHLKQFQEAEAHLNLIFDLDAQNPGALQALEKLYMALDRWDDVVRVLERKIGSTPEEDLRRALLLKLAAVHEEKRQDPGEAINTYKRLLEFDGRDERAVQALTRLYEETQRWQALIGMFQRALELTQDPQERVNLRYRIAGIQESQLQDPEAAINSYKAVLEEDPGHGLALKALERTYTQAERYPELLGVFERQYTYAIDNEERISLLSKMAVLHEETFGNLPVAIELNERILGIDPDNLAAVRKLELLFKEVQDYNKLILALTRHAEISKDPDERLDLQMQVAEVYYKELNKPDKAEEIYTAVLRKDPSAIRAIHDLGQLYERSGNWFNALEKLAQEAELLRGQPEAVELHFRMGSINAEMLMDTSAARSCYEQALELDAEHVPSLQALKAIHYAAREWEAYLKRLVQEAEAVKDPTEKAELFTAAGAFVQERNNDMDGAVRLYERALGIIPDHLNAAKPLADLEFRREGYERAEELLEIVVDKLDPTKDSKELCRQYYRLGYITEKQGKDQKALKNYQKAYDIDPTYLPALEGLGGSLVRAERWDDAQKIYQTILIHHRESLTDAEVVDYYWKLGDISDKMNQGDRAIRNLDKALEIDSNHLASLKLLADVHQKAQRYEEAYDALLKMAGLAQDDEKVALLMQLGSLSREKLQDAYRAIDAYEDANKLRRDDKEVLTALFNLYRDTKQGPKAVEVLEDLVRIEPDATTRVRLNHQLGEIYRDEIRNEQRAVQYFNAALDLDPTYVRSFESIEKLLTEKKMWRALEENYRAMIQRTPKEQVKIRTVLWTNLAQLYHRVLKDVDNAIMAYTVLCRADPENLELQEALADLMARRPGKEDEAIAQYQLVLPRSNEPGRALHTLARLYLNRRLVDRTLCAVQALRLLKEATDEEASLIAHYQGQLPQRHQKAMTEKLWDALAVHDRAQTPIALVSTILYRLAPGMGLRDARDLGLQKRKDAARVDIDQSLVFSVKQLAGVAAVLGATPFELWQLRGSDMAPTLHPVYPLTMTIGDQNPMFKEMPQKMLWALWGRMLSFMRPAFVLPRVLGPQAFRVLCEAALFVTDTTAKYETDPKELDKIGRNLLRVEGLESALKSVDRKTISRKEPPHLELFYEGMEHTAVRASLLACNDVDTTVQTLKIQDPQSPPVPKNRLRELILFLVSEQYAELRGRLGLAMKAG